MKTLLIDNYDSFTFNLYQLIAEVNRIPPIVVRNDSASWNEIKNLEFDNIVISPGPGRPENESDFGICKQAILEATVPILGVCLGHQGICHLFGGKVDYAEQVMHGRSSDIFHSAVDIFKDIPSPFSAIRYHSLYVKELPEEMEKLAWTANGMLMAAKHQTRPIWGVQFHPESIKTQYGHQLIENFRTLTAAYLRERKIEPTYYGGRAIDMPYNVMKFSNRPSHSTGGGTLHGKPFKVLYRRVPIHLDAEDVFIQNYADSAISFWLDSALVRGFSRFSFMGDMSGPYSEFISYNVSEKKISVTFNNNTEILNESILDYLDRKLKERYTEVEGLPFDFNLGYTGYFGYEIKADCGFESPHISPTPDAAFVFADRMIAFDHEEKIAYLVCLDDKDNLARAETWLNEMYHKLKKVPKAPHWSRALNPHKVLQTFRHTPEAYLERIKSAKQQIKKGETYEVCLTNMITQYVNIDPFNTYRALRSTNPAPYATYLKFPGVSVLCSSPERFITVDSNGVVESKPIKGTRKRGISVEEDEELYKDLSTNEKDRSENLMIVDLLRNDIGQVSDVGSVHVSNIFAVESYATVHQLVSTVRGRLRREASVIDCIRAAFPGGSMTGAPKKRTMEIIDELEGAARGIYSGSMGYIGLNGSADLNIVIRTIVATEQDVTIGVGGAIIDLSDPQDELDEMILKSLALVKSLSETNLDK